MLPLGPSQQSSQGDSVKINFRSCPNSQWLSISSRAIEISPNAPAGCVLSFPPCPAVPLVFPPSLCSHCTSLLAVPQARQPGSDSGPGCLQSPVHGSPTPGKPNGSPFHLVSVVNVACSAMPSLARYLTWHPPPHVGPIPFPCLSPCLALIIIKTTAHIYFPVYYLLLPARRRLQRAIEHSAWHSVKVVEEMGGMALEPRLELHSESEHLSDQTLKRERGPPGNGCVGPGEGGEGQRN